MPENPEFPFDINQLAAAMAPAFASLVSEIIDKKLSAAQAAHGYAVQPRLLSEDECDILST